MFEIALHLPLRELWEVNSEIGVAFKGIATIPGDIERIFLGYLKNWLNREVEESEKEVIKEKSAESYGKEWKSTDEQVHDAIENAIENAEIKSGNENMNLRLAKMAVPLISYMLHQHRRRKRLFRILDLGAGDGDTMMAILHEMRVQGMEKDAERLHFYTLEPGWKKVHPLGKRLERLQFQPVWTPIGSTFEREMEGRVDDWFDMVVTSAVLHHFSDPDYLYTLHDKLTEEGIIVVGDWYTNIWSHPALLVPTLHELGVHPDRIRRYLNFFGLRKSSCEELEDTFTREERKANEQMRKYIVELSKELKLLGRESQLSLFEAHQSLADHMRNAKEAGIETERGILSKKHPAFGRMKGNYINLIKGSNIASVWAGAKVTQGPISIRS